MDLFGWWRGYLARNPLIAVLVAVVLTLAALGGAFAVLKEIAPHVLLLAYALRWSEVVALALMVVCVLLLAAILGAIARSGAVDEVARKALVESVRALSQPPPAPPEAIVQWNQELSKQTAERQEEETARSRLRESCGLRPLRQPEVGLQLNELPYGVYGFADTIHIAEYERVPHSKMQISFAGDLTFAERLQYAPVREAPRLSGNLEVHREKSGTYVVGFAPETEAPAIVVGRGTTATLFLARASFAPVAVRLPADRVKRATLVSSTSPQRLKLVLNPPAGPPPPTATAPAPPSSPESSE